MLLNLVRAIGLVAMCALPLGCSMIDGLQGGDDPGSIVCDPLDPFCDPSDGGFSGEQFTCATPLDLGFVTIITPVATSVSTCDQDQGPSAGACSPGGFGDMIFAFFTDIPGEFEICATGVSGGSMALFEVCDDSNGGGGRAPMCLDMNSCTSVNLDGGEHFLQWQADSPSDCGPLEVVITATSFVSTGSPR